jgi:hypothetical protein
MTCLPERSDATRAGRRHHALVARGDGVDCLGYAGADARIGVVVYLPRARSGALTALL